MDFSRLPQHFFCGDNVLKVEGGTSLMKMSFKLLCWCFGLCVEPVCPTANGAQMIKSQNPGKDCRASLVCTLLSHILGQLC